MTIHSDWSRLFHEECPEAFTTHIPQKSPNVGVIDGHLQLMCLHKGLPSWDAFLQYLFVKPVMQLFEAGCPRVVLCFDCYDNVPAYKSMTQTKRVSKQKKQVCVFDPAHGLPASIPDDPMLFLMNRDFKLKLVEMICERVPLMIQAKLQSSGSEKLHKDFIIDYKRAVVYSFKKEGIALPRVLDELQPMGESDVKFCRYVDLYGSALVHAIDGDYLAIALLYYTQRAPVLGACNRIHIFRQLSSFAPADSCKKKRLKTATAAVDASDNKSKRKIVKCWVDVQLLYVAIIQSMRHSQHDLINIHTGAPFTDADAVRAAVFLMLLAGTDFSRSLPWLGPKRLWDTLPQIVAPLLQATAITTEIMVMDSALLRDAVVAGLYRLVFAKHSGLPSASLDQTLMNLQRSKLSDSVKGKFPSSLQVLTTIQNVAWVMAYWKTYNGLMETPLDGTHGYVQCPISRQITFADLLL